MPQELRVRLSLQLRQLDPVRGLMVPAPSQWPVMPYRSLIVEDEPVARAGLRRMLCAHPEIIVIGEAKNGAEAVAAFRADRPDIVFLDIQMPVCDGFAALSAQCMESVRPAVIVVTTTPRYAVTAFDFHAVDFVLKPFDEERLTIAVRRAVQFLRGVARGGGSTGSVPARLVVRDRERLVFVEPRAVSSFEAYGNYVRLMVEGHYL